MTMVNGWIEANMDLFYQSDPTISYCQNMILKRKKLEETLQFA